MTDTILKQNAGRGGAVIVSDGTPPAGEYCAFQWITPGGSITVALNTPLMTGTQTGIIFEAGTRIDTPVIGGTGTIDGTAIFYKALTS